MSFSNPEIINCTISENVAMLGGGGIYTDASYPEVRNCILWNDSPDEIWNEPWRGPTVTYSNIEGGYSGTGNIDEDPDFINPEENDFHIASFSPCIDTGTSEDAPLEDFEGDNRPWGEGFDMGADEYSCDNAWLTLRPVSFDLLSQYPELQIENELLIIKNAGLENLSYTIHPGDEPWLNVEGNLTGTLAPSEFDSLNLVFSILALDPGIYLDTLIAVSNDPVGSPVNIPVILSIYSHGIIRVPEHVTTIQCAIDVAVDGDTILVSDGTYKGTGNRNLDLLGKALILISESGPEATLIDCEYQGRGIKFEDIETGYSHLEGFSIAKGKGKWGGGIYCRSSSPVITNCFILDNLAISGGGICAIWYSSPAISNCLIVGNNAYNGGGINNGSTSIILDCIFNKNSANSGGAIYTDLSAIFVNCTVIENTAEKYGGAIYAENSSSPSSFINCTVVNNSAQQFGGGIFFGLNTTHEITNSIFWANHPEEIYNSYSNPTVVYSNIQDGWPGEGNIDENPRFMAPYEGNFHLKSNSPCIDTGDPTFEVPLGGGPRIDMGVYEYWHGWNILERRRID